ncbi:MAG TPA: hypothetical protein V6D08_13450 [Candidatus Obscuribacterales bacterium]
MEKFDKDGFTKSAALFRARIEHEGEIAAQVQRAMSLAGDAAIHLVGLSREIGGEAGPLLTATISETAVQISGGTRHVMLVPAEGVGNDSRLVCPRMESCGQILVYGHLSGHDETTLISSFRVYANGDCADADSEWSLDDGLDSLLHYLGRVVRASIFERQLCWPALDEMPAHLQKIPLSAERIQEEPLKKPCFGFECAL